MYFFVSPKKQAQIDLALNTPEVNAAKTKLKCGLKTLSDSACALAEAIDCEFTHMHTHTHTLLKYHALRVKTT